MPSFEYDRRYVDWALGVLESYLLADELYWHVDISAPSGEPGYPMLTLEGLLFALHRMQAYSGGLAEQYTMEKLSMGLEMAMGRYFSKDFPADTAKIILNETAVKLLELENPIGHITYLWNDRNLPYEVVGVETLTVGGEETVAKLKEVFGKKPAYADVPGLCKAATLEEIEAQGWSLNPGRYVGVAPGQKDDVDFAERLEELNEELENIIEDAFRGIAIRLAFCPPFILLELFPVPQYPG